MSTTSKGGNRTIAEILKSDWSIDTAEGPAISLNQQTQTAITGHPKQKNLQAVLTHDKVDDAFFSFLGSYLNEDADAANAGNYEDGAARGSTDNDPTTLVLAHTYTGKNASMGRRLVYVYAARALSGGDMTLQNQTLENTVTLAAAAPGDDIDLPTTIWDSTLIDITDTNLPTVLPSGSYGLLRWIKYV